MNSTVTANDNLPHHFGQKKAGDLFQISCLMRRCVGGRYLAVKVWDKLTRCVEKDKWAIITPKYP
ncbi:hypothetical protein [uncultured Phascolarctobacterium sp.]|uniref:hypothetical protein n=1 Tax=uncultured Phascolarctobacterium sp. TaxID=512296 RepID=UPI0025DD8981|nr:hypothetical protein [uncultured Phascolarctobacterium sp.]